MINTNENYAMLTKSYYPFDLLTLMMKNQAVKEDITTVLYDLLINMCDHNQAYVDEQLDQLREDNPKANDQELIRLWLWNEKKPFGDTFMYVLPTGHPLRKAAGDQKLLDEYGRSYITDNDTLIIVTEDFPNEMLKKLEK